MWHSCVLICTVPGKVNKQRHPIIPINITQSPFLIQQNKINKLHFVWCCCLWMGHANLKICKILFSPHKSIMREFNCCFDILRHRSHALMTPVKLQLPRNCLQHNPTWHCNWLLAGAITAMANNSHRDQPTLNVCITETDQLSNVQSNP